MATAGSKNDADIDSPFRLPRWSASLISASTSTIRPIRPRPKLTIASISWLCRLLSGADLVTCSSGRNSMASLILFRSALSFCFSLSRKSISSVLPEAPVVPLMSWSARSVAPLSLRAAEMTAASTSRFMPNSLATEFTQRWLPVARPSAVFKSMDLHRARIPASVESESTRRRAFVSCTFAPAGVLLLVSPAPRSLHMRSCAFMAKRSVTARPTALCVAWYMATSVDPLAPEKRSRAAAAVAYGK